MQGVEISIGQYSGYCKGVLKTEPLDVVYAHRGGQTAKIGYIARADGASLLLVRWIEPDERETVRAAVEQLRTEEGLFSTSKHVASIPNPQLIKAYAKGDIEKKSSTTSTIVMPDGTPATQDDQELDDDEF